MVDICSSCLKSDQAYSWELACLAIASSPPPQHHCIEELGFHPTVFEGTPIQSWIQRDSTACTKGTAHILRAEDTVEFSAVEMNHPSHLNKSKSWLMESGAPDFPSLSYGQVFSFSPLVGKIEPETPLFEYAFSCSGPGGHFLQGYLYRNDQGHIRAPVHYLYHRFLFGFYSCIKIFKII